MSLILLLSLPFVLQNASTDTFVRVTSPFDGSFPPCSFFNMVFTSAVCLSLSCDKKSLHVVSPPLLLEHPLNSMAAVMLATKIVVDRFIEAPSIGWVAAECPQLAVRHVDT